MNATIPIIAIILLVHTAICIRLRIIHHAQIMKDSEEEK